MASRKRRDSRKPGDGRGGPHSWRPGIWLATLSTVVGVATGMFTLRDQMFPRESGTAVAVSEDAYQQSVGQVCTEVNRADKARVAELPEVRRRLERATKAQQQRDALLDAVRHELARAGFALGRFGALEAPKRLAARHASTRSAWSGNVDRVRGYAERLDRARSWQDLRDTLVWLSGQRTAIGQNAVVVNAGLERLGGPSCRIARPRLTRTFSLPRLPRDKPRPDDVTPPTATPPPATTPPPTPTPDLSSERAVPATPPDDDAGPSATTPGSTGGTPTQGGGGG